MNNLNMPTLWEEELKAEHRQFVNQAISAVNTLIQSMHAERNAVLQERQALQQSLSFLVNIKRFEHINRSVLKNDVKLHASISRILKENESVLGEEKDLRKLIDQEIHSLNSDLIVLAEFSKHLKRGEKKIFSRDEIRAMAHDLHTIDLHLKWRVKAERLEQEEVKKIHQVIEKAKNEIPE